jgi:hypothetical protein
MGNIVARSIYGAMQDQPRVVLEVQTTDGADPVEVQMSPAEARAVAYSILEAAESSETDAFVVRFFRAKIGLSLEQTAMVLRDFRTAREQIAREQPTPEQFRPED